MKRRKDGRFQRVVTYEGKKIVFYSRAQTEKAAIKDIEQQLLNYKQAEEKGKLFKVVADEWEAHHFPKIAYTTAHRYEVLLKHATSYFEGAYIKTIKPLQIERYLGGFADKDYTTKTIKDTFSVLRMIFKFAYIMGYIDSDPSQYITPPKGKESITRDALTNEQIEIVKNSINCTCGLLPYFLMYTGLRKGEVLALQFKDIDRKAKEIHVTKAVYHESNTPKIKGTKTKNGNRTVILLDCVADKLPKGSPEQYVFSKNGTEPMQKSYFQKQWDSYCAETGLKITAHQLRHTYATILFEADIGIKDTQALMGHSDISTTRNIYTHIRENRLQDTANKLNQYLTNI